MGSQQLETKTIKDNSFEDIFNGLSARKNNGKDVGRISNGLSTNIAQRRQPDLFKDLSEAQQNTLSKCDEAHYVDRKGKTICLSVEDILLVKALSSYIPFNDPDVQKYIKAVNSMNANGNYSTGPKTSITIPVSVLQLSKDIIGDKKEASLRKVEERLRRLEEIEQVQTFNVNGEKYSMVRPLIRFEEQLYKHYSEIRSSRGRKKTQESEAKEKKILVGINIVYSPLFLYEATNKFCPLYLQRFLKVCKRNKTELFTILLSDLESKFRQYYLNSLKEEKAAKKKHKDIKESNREEYDRLVSEAKKKGLIYKSSTLTIRGRVTTDYETNRMQRNRFLPDLQRAINSLVEYGIITEKSFISKEKEVVYFCFNSDFVPKEEEPTFLLSDEAESM